MSRTSLIGWPERASRFGALVALAAAYFVLAKLGLALASVHPSASPIWPPSGLALGAMLLWGFRVWPAVLAGAFLANVTTFGSVSSSVAIAAGNTCEALVTAWLVERWCGGAAAFEKPSRVVKFAALTLGPGTIISATVGVGSLVLAGVADPARFGGIWMTWWLGDVGGQLLVAPVMVLWSRSGTLSRVDWHSLGWLLAGTAGVGVVAFSPLLEQMAMRGPLAFLAIAPLLWAALRYQQRETATAALVLSLFAVWGTLANGGPFAGPSLNEAFLLTLTFVISTALPSLVLSADVAVRRQSETRLTEAHRAVDRKVRERTEELALANRALRAEIEQRKRAEADGERQRVQLVGAQRLANLGSWAWDVGSGVVTWSEQLHEMFGVPPGSFGGTFDDYLARVHEEDRARIEAGARRTLATGEAFRMEERIVRPDGEIRHLQSIGELIRDASGNPVLMIGVCQDVTERKRADTALTESEERYRLLIDGVQDYAIYMLDPTGHVVSWNFGAERIKQYKTEEIIGRHLATFYTDEDRSTGLPARALQIAAGDGKFEAEGWRVRKDGSRFWASVVIDAIHDGSGKLIGFTKITRDITERRDAQAALESARDQLAQAQKMEALGQLTGSIAHDFNNLLMIVSGHAQILQRRLSDPKHLQAVEAITMAAQRGENLTRQLLTFARRQRLSPEVVDTALRIEAARSMLAGSLRGDIAFVCELAEGLWPVEVDVAEFELALVNLAVNARDAMPNGGRLTLAARNVRLDAGRAAALAPGDYVAIALQDTGIGIAPEILARIFDPFFTTKPLGKGTGLGLSQVHGFAHQAGGSVEVASEVGRGTTITLHLPRSRAPVASQDQEEAPPPSVAPVDGTVLLVEDNAEVAKVTGLLVEQLGYSVMHAPDAASALARLREGEKIAFVLSDIVMPGEMNGLELAHAIRKQFPRLPVLLTSGYSEAAHAAETRFPILRKPFELAELDRALRAAVAASSGAGGALGTRRGVN